MKKITALLLALAICLPQAPAFAVSEIEVSNVTIDSQSQDRYSVVAILENQTDKPREVTVRGQIFFFEAASPDTDRPAMVLRRDMTVILKEKEKREIRIRLINEGSYPKQRLRLKPEVRIRRQRIWHY